MSENLALWRRVCVTDPKAVKPITGKQYSGNSPKPYWIVEQLTATFGPCGIGWGFNILNERFERFSDTDTLHIAAVRFWYVLDGKRGELEQIGQTKASYTTSKGTFLMDEDAPKKSVTDALIKCASYLGFAGDIFSGRWDDSKYVAEAGKEWESRKREADDSAPKPTGQSERPPAKMEGKPGKWQLSVSLSPEGSYKDWEDIVIEASKLAMGLTSSVDELMELHKVNKQIYTRLQGEKNSNGYKLLMSMFTDRKKQLEQVP